MRLAVYGTLRRGSDDKGRIKGFSLVFPGTKSFPALIKNEKGKGAVVEMMEVDKEELSYYDTYENVEGGLYIRTTADVINSKTFTEVPDQDWLSSNTLMMMHRVDDYERKTSEF